jgi:hypothetical protein
MRPACAHKTACITLRYYYNFMPSGWLKCARRADYGDILVGSIDIVFLNFKSKHRREPRRSDGSRRDLRPRPITVTPACVGRMAHRPGSRRKPPANSVRMTRVAVTPTAGGRKTRRLERISRRRSTESLPGLPGVVRLGSDNLMIFVESTMRLYRLYSGASLPTTIPVKMSILASQILVQYHYRQRLILISDCRSLVLSTSVRLGRTPFMLCIFG